VNPALLQPIAWCAAFWTALLSYTRRARPPRPLRFACALTLGAALAHAGCLVLHAPAVWPALRVRPGLLLDASRGFCVLFLPLGLLALERSPAAFASLPLALAVARLGCLAAGCCVGERTSLPWALAGRHPTALYEIAGLLVLHAWVRGAGSRVSEPLVLGGIGALRLLVDPMRAAPPLGAPLIAPAAIAAGWLALAAYTGARAARSRQLQIRMPSCKTARPRAGRREFP
jgi:Prolipoprotein diacylglyceryl transferase